MSVLLEIKQTIQQQRQQAIQVYQERKCRPETLLVNLRKIVDQGFKHVVEHFPLPAGAALCPVGGYGRGELYPYSDIDILILLEREPDSEDKAKLEAFIQTLWDLGLEVGHSVRTLEECLSEAHKDITIETSLLEARFLLGNRKLTNTLAKRFRSQHQPGDFFLAKKIEMQQRYTRYNDTPYSLEPNCKESPGALRDIQMIQWLARSINVGTRWKDLVQVGLMMDSEAVLMKKLEHNFKRLRIELHLLAKKRDDRVLFHTQPQLAEVYKYKGVPGKRPSEVFMQHYYGAARSVTLISNFMVQSFQEFLFPDKNPALRLIDEDFQVLGQSLDIRLDDAFERKPTLLLKAFLVLQQHPELHNFSVRTQRAIWDSRTRIDAQFRANPIHKQLFLEILKQPQGIVHTFRRLSRLKILPMYIPVWRKIVGQMQHDLFHVYTVDQHTLMVIRNIRRFTMPEHAQEYPLASRLIADFEDAYLLYIAALFHDIAKGRGGDHSELGAVDARRFCKLHHISEVDTDLVVFLVANHLKMSNFAQKRDVSDPQVIQEFSDIVKTRRRLTALYLLTVADIRGTSPKVWNAWKGQLLESLFKSTAALLAGDNFDRQTVLSKRKDEANRIILLAGLSESDRDRFWRTMDVAYFLRNESSDIAWHTRILHQHTHSTQAVVKARPIEKSDSIQVVVFTKDVTKLFEKISAYFFRKQINILDARIHTSTDGYALDTFIVSSELFDNPRNFVTILEHELSFALDQDLPEKPLEQTRKMFNIGANIRRSRTFPIVPSLELQPDEYSKSWRLSITATDTAGILYNLAHLFNRHGVNLQMAKVLTLGDRAEDVFIIDGQSLGNPRTQILFERDILQSLNELTKQK